MTTGVSCETVLDDFLAEFKELPVDKTLSTTDIQPATFVRTVNANLYDNCEQWFQTISGKRNIFAATQLKLMFRIKKNITLAQKSEKGEIQTSDICKLYSSFNQMQKTREENTIAPSILDVLQYIETEKNICDLLAYLVKRGIKNIPFEFEYYQQKNSENVIQSSAIIRPSGLAMPSLYYGTLQNAIQKRKTDEFLRIINEDQENTVVDNDFFTKLHEKYKKHIKKMFQLYASCDPSCSDQAEKDVESWVGKIFEFEKELAEKHPRPEDKNKGVASCLTIDTKTAQNDFMSKFFNACITQDGKEVGVIRDSCNVLLTDGTPAIAEVLCKYDGNAEGKQVLKKYFTLRVLEHFSLLAMPASFKAQYRAFYESSLRGVDLGYSHELYLLDFCTKQIPDSLIPIMKHFDGDWIKSCHETMTNLIETLKNAAIQYYNKKYGQQAKANEIINAIQFKIGMPEGGENNWSFYELEDDAHLATHMQNIAMRKHRKKVQIITTLEEADHMEDDMAWDICNACFNPADGKFGSITITFAMCTEQWTGLFYGFASMCIIAHEISHRFDTHNKEALGLNKQADHIASQKQETNCKNWRDVCWHHTLGISDSLKSGEMFADTSGFDIVHDFFVQDSGDAEKVKLKCKIQWVRLWATKLSPQCKLLEAITDAHPIGHTRSMLVLLQ